MTSRSEPLMVCGHTANGLCSAFAGVKYEPAIPSCVICSCIEQAPSPNLEGRMMRCSYYGHKWGRNSGPIYPCNIRTDCSRATGCRCEVASDMQQPFFEFKGEGSKYSLTHCTNCGFTKNAHEYDWPGGTRVSKVPPKGICKNFQPQGAAEFDLYYCGCFGWD